MAERTQHFPQLPWDGGFNSALDPGLIPPAQLQRAENCITTNKGSRKTRQGMQYVDKTHTVTHRASSGTTRTLTLSSAAGISTNDIVSVMHTDSFNAYYDGTHKVTVSGSTITYTATGSLTESTTAVSTVKVGKNGTGSVLGIYDYWKEVAGGNSRFFVSVIGSTPAYYQYDSNWLRSALTVAAGASAVSGATRCSFEVFANRLIISFDGLNNKPKYWFGTGDVDDIANYVTAGDQAPPDFSLSRVYLGRLWTNDKNNPSRLHYTQTGHLGKWNGSGDSGALDIDPSDGDEEGITAIFPPVKGNLFVAKGRKLYRIRGNAPENFQIEPVSAGVGCSAHNAVVAIDQDDVMYPSHRGWHFVSATDQYGDFAGSFASLDIQPTFNSLNQARLEAMCASYVPTQNIVAYGASSQGDSVNSDLYIYNVATKQWLHWPDIKCTALALRSEDGKQRLYIGTDNGRILQTETGKYWDFGIGGASIDAPLIAGTRSTDPTKVGVRLRLKSGAVYPDNSALAVKRFLTLSLFYRPLGSYSFVARVKVDNYSTQSFNFVQSGSFDSLGTAFTLGASTLGGEVVFSPFTTQIDGVGHGVTIEIEASMGDQPVELYGYSLGWERAEYSQETIT